MSRRKNGHWLDKRQARRWRRMLARAFRAGDELGIEMIPEPPVSGPVGARPLDYADIKRRLS